MLFSQHNILDDKTNEIYLFTFSSNILKEGNFVLKTWAIYTSAFLERTNIASAMCTRMPTVI